MMKAAPLAQTTQTRLFRFLVVGGTAAGVQFSVLALARNFWNSYAAFTLGYAFSTLVHYGLNRFWALPSQRVDTGRQFGEYLLTVALSYLINLGAFVFAHR